MLFTTLLLTGLASAAPALNARQTTPELAPWEITVANGYQGGRPNSSPPTLGITIKQPNSIRLQTTSTGDAVLPPFEARCPSLLGGTETLCITVGDAAAAYGNFTATLSGNMVDFTVKFKETREETVYQQKYVRVYEGEQVFNQETGWRVKICSAGGACLYEFRDGLPKVKQVLTESVGSCEEATTAQ
ncbi:hypothetical protein E8E13_008222 [Curvularia kusanoi]|uniref:Uncharacterized protein n=1 Tax=Curvularia kusanoi TaxID=90978 RepID=A0A9P4WEE8_CURKU|nr:hypothetical protein E8E13_008222 [Curvularia kusanoi]